MYIVIECIGILCSKYVTRTQGSTRIVVLAFTPHTSCVRVVITGGSIGLAILKTNILLSLREEIDGVALPAHHNFNEVLQVNIFQLLGQNITRVLQSAQM